MLSALLRKSVTTRVPQAVARHARSFAAVAPEVCIDTRKYPNLSHKEGFLPNLL